MKTVTCQASACRYTATEGTSAGVGGLPGFPAGPPSAGTAAPASAENAACVRPTCFACGSHSRAASAAGPASQPRVSSTEPPVLFQSGTLTRDPVIAPTDSAVM